MVSNVCFSYMAHLLTWGIYIPSYALKFERLEGWETLVIWLWYMLRISKCISSKNIFCASYIWQVNCKRAKYPAWYTRKQGVHKGIYIRRSRGAHTDIFMRSTSGVWRNVNLTVSEVTDNIIQSGVLFRSYWQHNHRVESCDSWLGDEARFVAQYRLCPHLFSCLKFSLIWYLKHWYNETFIVHNSSS